MNVIPTAPPPVAATGPVTVPPADGTDAALAESFTALVGMLSAQLDAEAAPTESEDGERGLPETGDVDETEEVAPPTRDAVLLPWSVPPPPPPGDPGAAVPVTAPIPIEQDASVPTAPVVADGQDPAHSEPAASSRVSDPSGRGGGDAEVAEELLPERARVGAPASEAARPEVPAEPRPAAAPPSGVAAAPAGDGSTAVAANPVPLRPEGAAGATAQPAAGHTAAPSLPDQLVEVVGPLRQAPDGTHRVSVQLRPDELGEVLVDVRVRGSEIHLSIRADLAGTAELLRDAVGELRAELESAGFSSGDLDIGSRADPGPADDRRAGSEERARAAHAGAPDDDLTPVPQAASSGLDVRL